MNPWDALVLGLVALAVFFALRQIRRGGCSGCCSGCGASCPHRKK